MLAVMLGKVRKRDCHVYGWTRTLARKFYSWRSPPRTRVILEIKWGESGTRRQATDSEKSELGEV